MSIFNVSGFKNLPRAVVLNCILPALPQSQVSEMPLRPIEHLRVLVERSVLGQPIDLCSIQILWDLAVRDGVVGCEGEEPKVFLGLTVRTLLGRIRHINANSYPPEGLRGIAMVCPEVQSLDLSSCHHLTADGFRSLSYLSSLEKLKIEGTQVGSADFFTGFPHLADLDLPFWKGRDIRPFQTLPLTSLKLIYSSEFEGSGLGVLPDSLQTLDLKGCDQLVVADIAHLARLTQLQDLTLPEGLASSNAALAHLSRLPLRKLALMAGFAVGFRCDDEGMVHLRSCPLTGIELVTNLVSDEGFRHLSHHSLERLVLWDNDVFTGNGLQHLPRTLQDLELRELPRLTLRVLEHLIGFPKLESLKIEKCPEVGSDDLRRLRKKIPSLKELVHDDSILLTRN